METWKYSVSLLLEQKSTFGQYYYRFWNNLILCLKIGNFWREQPIMGLFSVKCANVNEIPLLLAKSLTFWNKIKFKYRNWRKQEYWWRTWRIGQINQRRKRRHKIGSRRTFRTSNYTLRTWRRDRNIQKICKCTGEKIDLTFIQKHQKLKFRKRYTVAKKKKS